MEATNVLCIIVEDVRIYLHYLGKELSTDEIKDELNKKYQIPRC